MLNLTYEPADVHTGREPAPFVPSREQEARALGYSLALAGEAASLRRVRPSVSWQFALGTIEGTRARALASARALGYDLGYGTGINEPPPGFDAEEGTAYREGFAEGDADSDRDLAAWLASAEADRMEEGFGDAITDEDVYLRGGVS